MCPTSQCFQRHQTLQRCRWLLWSPSRRSCQWLPKIPLRQKFLFLQSIRYFLWRRSFRCCRWLPSRPSFQCYQKSPSHPSRQWIQTSRWLQLFPLLQNCLSRLWRPFLR